jgi:hypothetical protein
MNNKIRMKKYSFFAVLILISGISLLPGCAKDSSTPVNSDPRSPFFGTWSVNEIHTKLTYDVSISADTGKTGVFIANFGLAGPSVKAHAVITGNEIGLSPAGQTMSNGWVIDGSGSMTGTTKIDWTYQINDGATLIYCQATYTKK